MKKINFRKIAAYLFLLVLVLYVITGYGITRYQIVEKITFGILSKALSFRLHRLLIYPLIILLIIHLYYSCSLLDYFKKFFKSEKKKSKK